MSIADRIRSTKVEFPDEVKEKVENSLLWSLWAVYAVEEALQWPVEELAVEMAHRPDYGRKIQEVMKMLLIELYVTPLRTELINDMIAHVRAALVQAGLDASSALMYAPINYEVVPEFGGVAASDVNCLRSKVLQEG